MKRPKEVRQSCNMHIAQIVLLIARFILIAIALLVLTGAAQLHYKDRNCQAFYDFDNCINKR